MRRLSSSTATGLVTPKNNNRVKSSSTSSNETASLSTSSLNPVHTLFGSTSYHNTSKYSTHHHYHGSISKTNTNVSGSSTTTSSLSSSIYSYNSPLSSTKSSICSNTTLNLLSISTNNDHSFYNQSFSCSPLQSFHKSPTLQHKHLFDENIFNKQV